MKKKTTTIAVGISLLTTTLAACGNGDNAGDDDTNTLSISASNVPHAEILEEAEPLLAEQGIELDITIAEDYTIPNIALNEGSVDANYYQHRPYLDNQIQENGYDFVEAGAIHLEPIGLYSEDFASPKDIPDGAEIIMSNSVSDHGRVLALLEDAGVITLAEDAGVDATESDIEENPKNITFRSDVNPELLPQVYNNGEGDVVVINSNYALDAGLDPLEDSIFIEEADESNPYVNLIVVNAGDENKEEIQTLVDVLKSDEIKTFIKENYGNAIVPVE